ncbi:MAG: hypothetical protein JNL25_13640 [Rhodospirillaceae bacterium]|nr:hypothetical protein [Rhodospirillaceae bacterium]
MLGLVLLVLVVLWLAGALQAV